MSTTHTRPSPAYDWVRQPCAYGVTQVEKSAGCLVAQRPEAQLGGVGMPCFRQQPCINSTITGDPSQQQTMQPYVHVIRGHAQLAVTLQQFINVTRCFSAVYTPSQRAAGTRCLTPCQQLTSRQSSHAAHAARTSPITTRKGRINATGPEGRPATTAARRLPATCRHRCPGSAASRG